MTENKELFGFRKYEILWFFVLATGFSFFLWLPLVLSPEKSEPSVGSYWWLHYVGGLGPALSAFVMIYFGTKDDRVSYRQSLLRISKQALVWILLGGLLPILLFAFVFLFLGMLSGKWLQFEDLLNSEKLPSFGIFSIIFVEIVFFGFGEELGWRGYAWPRIRNRFGFLTSSLIITIPWALWHFPTFFYNPNMTQLGVAGTVGWVLSLFTGAVILGWLVDCAKGNVLPAVLFHGILDVVFVSKAIYGIYEDYLGIAVVILALLITAASFSSKLFNLKLERN